MTDIDRLCIFLAGAAAALASTGPAFAAPASQPALGVTYVRMAAPQGQAATTVVGPPDVKAAPLATTTLAFAKLPDDAAVTGKASCAVQVVLAAPFSGGDTTRRGGALQLRLEGKPLAAPYLAEVRIPNGAPKGTLLTLKSGKLCAEFNAAKGDLKLSLNTPSPNASIQLVGDGDADVANWPRFAVTAPLSAPKAPELIWTQVRGNARRDGRAPGFIPDRDGVRDLGVFKAQAVQANFIGAAGARTSVSGADVPQSPLLAGERLIDLLWSPVDQRVYRSHLASIQEGDIVSGYGAKASDSGGIRQVNKSGDAVEAATAANLLDGATYTALSQQYLWVAKGSGLYAFPSNVLQNQPPNGPVQEIAVASNMAAISAPLTVGVRDMVFVVRAKMGVSPEIRGYARDKLIWRYNFADGRSSLSALALSNDESSGYVLVGAAEKGADPPYLLAIDAVSGRCHWRGALDGPPKVADGAPALPMVAGNWIYFTGGGASGPLYRVKDDAPKFGLVHAAAQNQCAAVVKKLEVVKDLASAEVNLAALPAAGALGEIYFATIGDGSQQAERDSGAICVLEPDGAAAHCTRKPASCEAVNFGKVTSLVSDTSPIGNAGASQKFSEATHLYAAVHQDKQLVTMTFAREARSEVPKLTRCRIHSIPELGPGLTLGRNGALYSKNVTTAGGRAALHRLVGGYSDGAVVTGALLPDLGAGGTARAWGALQIKGFPGRPTVQAAGAKTSLVADSAVSLSSNVVVKPGGYLDVVAGERIDILPGVEIEYNGRLRLTIGKSAP